MGHCFAGVDTHSEFHVIVVIDDQGRRVDECRITTDVAGLAAGVEYLRRHAPARVGVEGTASYGAGIARALTDAGMVVVEVTRPNRAERRRLGKSDVADAFQAALAARSMERVSPAKTSARLAELRSHYVLRESALKGRTEVGNAIHSLALYLTPGVRIGKLGRGKIRNIIADGGVLGAAAARWLMLDEEAEQHLRIMRTWLAAYYPGLLGQFCVGPVSAAQLVLAAGDNPDRLVSESSFAHLAGVAPIPASSGKHQRMRLNRGGDRRANQALWRIAYLRYSTDERTINYVTRREAEHKTRPEILRCLKRYIARELFPYLHPTTSPETPPLPA